MLYRIVILRKGFDSSFVGLRVQCFTESIHSSSGAASFIYIVSDILKQDFDARFRDTSTGELKLTRCNLFV